MDPIVPEDEVPEDAVGFLAAGQEIRIVASDLDGFGASLLGDQRGCQPCGHGCEEENRDTGKT